MTQINFSELEEATLEKMIFSRKKSAIFSDLDGELVILEMESGVYYGLDSMGSHIWGLMEKKISFNDMISSLLDEFSVSVEQCRKEVKQFLQQMVENQLLAIDPGANADH